MNSEPNLQNVPADTEFGKAVQKTAEQIAEGIAAEMPLEQADFAGMNSRAAATMPLTPEAVEQWHSIVRFVIRKAKGLKEEDVVELPEGETGTYIAYALDAHGNLSTGKRHGRRQPRLKTADATKNRLAGLLFGNYITSLFKQAQAQAKIDGGDPKPLDPQAVGKGQKWAMRKAEEIALAPARKAAKALRQRQQTSRRINAGLIPGNRDKRSHASA